MYKLIFIVFLLFQLQSLAQVTTDSIENHENYIINVKDYRKGIYTTFKEFKYNRPSIVEDFLFDGKNLWLTNRQTGRKEKIKRNKVWGFCDGSKTFVRWRKYDEILLMGRYCYFKEKGTRIVFGVSVFPPMILPIPVPYKDELIINFNTGDPFLLSKRVMKHILTTDDKELLSDYKKEKQKGKKHLEYIAKYNQRNTAKIK